MADKLKSLLNRYLEFERKRRKRYTHRRDKDYWQNIKMVILMGAWGFGWFTILAFALAMGGYATMAKIMFVLALFSPVLGDLMYKALEFLSDRTFAQIFWPRGGKTARAHSKGESLVQHEEYEDAVTWFAAMIMADPTDWRAQWRIVEILEEFLDDPERLAEEQHRLLKTEGVPDGLWMQTAMNLGEEWIKLGYPDKAINTYKGLLWRMPDTPDAEEIRRRLAELKAL